MKLRKDISKRNAFILILGMIIGMALIGQPIAKHYVDDLSYCQVDSEDETTDQEGSQEKLSILEAVTPAAQFQVITTYYHLLHTPVVFVGEIKHTSIDFIEKLPQKLQKVLFNFIIATNAP
ncbi:hypothetical protein BFP72_14685 [Reichenbachiella sp. 5M10]|uniref:hypothetical protein n=1 Tax=Reichenbachiella sp. 5M10 TaxID=1889772 RepID=UPI000C1610F9|nr:hypothetical protein [Reichenbachiella sp. 5M10]PIB36558.1 hypothetical protein BFP72_14685 [Reichenbachiella sp. 5M10]